MDGKGLYSARNMNASTNPCKTCWCNLSFFRSEPHTPKTCSVSAEYLKFAVIPLSLYMLQPSLRTMMGIALLTATQDPCCVAAARDYQEVLRGLDCVAVRLHLTKPISVNTLAKFHIIVSRTVYRADTHTPKRCWV